MKDYYGKKWTFSAFRLHNGSKQVGSHLWWNSQRLGWYIMLGPYEIQIMREWK